MKQKPEPAPARKSITLPPELWEQVSEIRFAERIGSEAEAVRQIMAAGIRALSKKIKT